MFRRFSEQMMSCFASNADACFAASAFLLIIMMGAGSLVSIIFVLAVLVSAVLLVCSERRSGMVSG